MTRPDAEWYAQGLRFQCTMCGQCCTGPPGFVLFSPEEGRRIARRLGVTEQQFLDRYTHQTDAGRSFNEILTEHGYDCVFLDRASEPGKAICSLYEDRPTQCRTFPFWPEHLESRKAWKRLARSCEGVGRGDHVPVTQIRVQRDAQIGARRGRSGEAAQPDV